MSMLKYFFELGCDRALFDGLQIMQEERLCEEYMGRFPVISISLKGVDGNTFETARSMLCSVIGWEALRFQLLTESEKLSEAEKKLYTQLFRVGEESFEMSDGELVNGLLTLSNLLRKHYGRKVIILIDEYDVPLDKAQQNGYYDAMVGLIRNLFHQALKSNDSLQFADLTGCLRITKESIFTGLNNLRIFSIAEVQFDEYFGFTDREVKELLSYYNLSGHYDEIREWYDGYRFGNVDVYCPWDVISYCGDLRSNPNAQPKAYWANTGDTAILRRLLQKAEKASAKREIEQLIAGETIRKEIRPELTYRDLDQSIENIWSVLLTSGYLTWQGTPSGERFELKIPNLEIRKIFVKQIYSWFQETAERDGETLSIRDTFVRKDKKENLHPCIPQAGLRYCLNKEFGAAFAPNFYHGILLGLLAYKDSWGVYSNKESGEGYSDILVEIEEERIGIVVEVKYPDEEDLAAGCAGALEQIEKLGYEEALRDNGMETILKYGIACNRKHCKVMRH